MAERRRKPRLTTIIALVLMGLLAASAAIATFYTDLLWFDELGQTGVFWRTIGWRWATGALFAVLSFVIVYVNLRIARSMAPTRTLRAVEDAGSRFEVTLQNARQFVEKLTGPASLVLSLVVGLIAGIAVADSWEVFALAFNGGPFGITDPQFSRDLGFYFFTMPALDVVRQWLTGILIFTLLAATVVHVLTGSIRPWDRWRGFDPHVKAHLSVLGGLIIVTQALAYWLDIYKLNYSPRGQVVGASYTDVHAQLPAYQILIAVAIVSGVILLVNIRVRGWRLPLIAIGTWLAAAIVIGSIYPMLIQQFRVAPNEVAAEVPYLERNIAATRAAFGLDAVDVRAFPAEESLTATAVAANAETISNVRLWDPAIAVQTYQQLQAFRTYYNFHDVDVDRYTVDGVRRQVLISAREMNVEHLADQAQTWVNQHLVYTHGYGVVVSPVSESSSQGYPHFIVKDIPPTSTTSDEDLKVTQPAIYFGETAGNYVVAATQLPEFDYPVGDANAETSYSGAGGIPVGGGLGRVAFALRFSAPQIVFSKYIRPESRVLFRRNITERIAAIAPWLAQDGDPYPAIVDGRVVWVIDCYTVSDRYPYSERYGGISYIRNSVKATVDAYDGTTTLYAIDESDSLLKAWRAVFPDLVTDGDLMPEGVREHFRYPEDLFALQAEVYKTYHMLDPKVFYNKEDQWALPGEAAEDGGAVMVPFYVLMELPQEETQDFMMMMPFTPRTKDNMIGWMAAKSDPGKYGERVVYTFPKQRLVLGPEQVSARINQDPEISQQLTLWSQRGSNVLFGNLLVIPIEDSIVYIQPLYLQAEKTAMPQLTRVIVAYADMVAMEEDLKTSLLAVFGEARTAGEDGTVADAGTARELYDKAVEAQRAGDWAAYGRYIEELGKVLEALAGSIEETATP